VASPQHPLAREEDNSGGGEHMNTPMAAVFSILSITTHHHVMANGGEHLHWFSMARFGCPHSSVYHNMPSHHGS
jgi:hypothetical protein